MALLKYRYLSFTKANRGPTSATGTVLPDPNGPLCECISSDVIDKTNKEVEAAISAQSSAQVSQFDMIVISPSIAVTMILFRGLLKSA